MLGSYQRLSLLSTLLLSSVATANRFEFSVQNITILNTDQIEDDLTLAIAASTPNGNATKNYFLGPFNANGTMREANYTVEIDLGASLTNFSVVIGLVQVPEDQTDKVTDLLLTGAATLSNQASQSQTSRSTNTSTLSSQVNSLFNASADCNGARVIPNATYYANTSDPSELDIAKFTVACTANTFLYEPTSAGCGSATNYSIIYCLERLDPEEQNAGVSVTPGLVGGFVAMGVALLFGAFV